jgi:hypothetical protein
MASISRPVSEVFRNILDNLQEIVRSEAKLAKAEVREELVRSSKRFTRIGIAALSGFFACAYLLLAAFLALCRAVPDWAAAVIVAGGSGLLCTLSVIAIQRHRAGSGRGSAL